MRKQIKAKPYPHGFVTTPDEEYQGWHPTTRRPKKRKRVRRPTLRSVIAQTNRAGISAASYTQNVDGSITVTTGAPAGPDLNESIAVDPANPWDTVLQ